MRRTYYRDFVLPLDANGTFKRHIALLEAARMMFTTHNGFIKDEDDARYHLLELLTQGDPTNGSIPSPHHSLKMGGGLRPRSG